MPGQRKIAWIAFIQRRGFECRRPYSTISFSTGHFQLRKPSPDSYRLISRTLEKGELELSWFGIVMFPESRLARDDDYNVARR
jgi:hypothetical protein